MTHRAYLFERKMPPLLHIDLTCLLSDRYKKHSKLACMGLTPTFLTFMRVMRGRLSRYIVIVPSTSSGTVGRQAQGPWGFFENTPHEEVFRECPIFGAILSLGSSNESRNEIRNAVWAKRVLGQAKRAELERIEWLLKSDNRPPRQDVFALFLLLRFSF